MIGQEAAIRESYNHIMKHFNLFTVDQLKALRDTCGMAVLRKIQMCDYCGGGLIDNNMGQCTRYKCFNDILGAIPLVVEPVAEPLAEPVAQPVLRPKVSREAERYWPYMRAKRVVKEIFRHYGRVNHFDAITILAQKIGMTIDELYKMNPITYFERLKNRRDDRMNFTTASKFFDVATLTELTYQLTRIDGRKQKN